MHAEIGQFHGKSKTTNMKKNLLKLISLGTVASMTLGFYGISTLPNKAGVFNATITSDEAPDKPGSGIFKQDLILGDDRGHSKTPTVEDEQLLAYYDG